MRKARWTRPVLGGLLALLVPVLGGCAGSATAPATPAAGSAGLGQPASASPATSAPAGPLTSAITTSFLPPGTTAPGGRAFDPAQAKRLANLVLQCDEARLPHQYSRNGDELVVAVRGTKSLADLEADLEVDSTPLGSPASGVNVHLGFYRRAMDILWAVDRSGGLAHLRESPSARLRLTGHSLGGAVAQILGALVVEQKIPADRVEIYTFGAPPFTTDAFSAKYSAMPIFRVETTGDTIPSVFNGPLAQYRHVGTRVGLSERGIFAVGEPGFYPNFEQRQANPSLQILGGLISHSLKLTYVPRMALPDRTALRP